MPSITVSNSPNGPLLNVVIGPSIPLQQALQAAQAPVPAPITATFLVDTGASHTVIDGAVLQPLGLTPTGSVSCHTPSTAGVAVTLPQYDLMVYVPGTAAGVGWMIEAIPVTASSFAGQNIQGLIGRDIIDRGLLVYNGSSGHFTLAY